METREPRYDNASSEINDIRPESQFRGISFSQFKKSDVKKELISSLLRSKIEPACYWSAELICAGHFADLWDAILLFYSKHVHLSNANICLYLDMRICDFKSIMNNGYTDLPIRMRNNDRIRRLFCEVMCVLCDAKRRHSFDNVKIKPDDLNMLAIRDKFKAPNTEYGENVFQTEDPKELFPFVNELAYSLTVEGNNQMNACYWIEWIIEYENRCRVLKEKMICERRGFARVDYKHQKDVVWIIWDIFMKEAERRCKILSKLVSTLMSLFCVRYTTGCHKKRKNLMYLAISLLCEPFQLEKEIIRHSQREMVESIKGKICSIYTQIKQNERSGGTDYLFMGVKSSNLEKTIAKLNALNSFGENFVPRL